MKKIGLLIVLFASCFMLQVSDVSAQYGCTGQYGYGDCAPTQNIIIDKLVGKPSTTTKGGQISYQYVDNLAASDYKFKPAEEVWFELKVKNTSTQAVSGVVVYDYLPAYLDPLEGYGTYDGSTRTINITTGDFAVDEEKIYTIKAKINSQDKLPADQGLICLLNRARAVIPGPVADEDTAQFCVEKQVTGVEKVPSSGPEAGMLLISGEMALLGMGLYLKKKLV